MSALGMRGQTEADDEWIVMPQRLRGRGRWLQERGRIKDAELMYDAATEIECLRRHRDALQKVSFAAQTSGGTAGPDAFLQEAISSAAKVSA